MSDDALRDTWLSLRQRVLARGLMPGDSDSLSLRDPASGQMAWGTATDASMRSLPLAPSEGRGTGATALHRTVYAARADVCAVLVGGGPFCRQMADFGGWMPAVFDEQIRQLGHMARPTDDLSQLPAALADGGNVALHAGQVLLLGMTPSRLALNAELFEKCAKAWVPAVAGGAKPRTLPWIVRYVANGRLMKEEARAREQVKLGKLPVETRGY
jgi:hypothetical protein